MQPGIEGGPNNGADSEVTDDRQGRRAPRHLPPLRPVLPKPEGRWDIGGGVLSKNTCSRAGVTRGKRSKHLHVGRAVSARGFVGSRTRCCEDLTSGAAAVSAPPHTLSAC